MLIFSQCLTNFVWTKAPDSFTIGHWGFNYFIKIVSLGDSKQIRIYHHPQSPTFVFYYYTSRTIEKEVDVSNNELERSFNSWLQFYRWKNKSTKFYTQYMCKVLLSKCYWLIGSTLKTYTTQKPTLYCNRYNCQILSLLRRFSDRYIFGTLHSLK